MHVWRAYAIRFDATNHPSIQTHHDHCDVTFNLCVARTCKGGHLVFGKALKYRHKVGMASIFWGEMLHHTHCVIGDGERVQIVLLMNFLKPSGLRIDRPLDFRLLSCDARRHVMSFLTLPLIAYVGYTCKELYAGACDPLLWRELYASNPTLCSFVSMEELESGSHLVASTTEGLSLEEGIAPYRRRVQLVSEDWKGAYGLCSNEAMMWSELQQKNEFFDAPTVPLRRCFTGCYPMHNQRVRLFVREETEASTDSDDVFGCEECGL